MDVTIITTQTTSQTAATFLGAQPAQDSSGGGFGDILSAALTEGTDAAGNPQQAGPPASEGFAQLKTTDQSPDARPINMMASSAVVEKGNASTPQANQLIGDSLDQGTASASESAQDNDTAPPVSQAPALTLPEAGQRPAQTVIKTAPKTVEPAKPANGLDLDSGAVDDAGEPIIVAPLVELPAEARSTMGQATIAATGENLDELAAGSRAAPTRPTAPRNPGATDSGAGDHAETDFGSGRSRPALVPGGFIGGPAGKSATSTNSAQQKVTLGNTSIAASFQAMTGPETGGQETTARAGAITLAPSTAPAGSASNIAELSGSPKPDMAVQVQVDGATPVRQPGESSPGMRDTTSAQAAGSATAPRHNAAFVPPADQITVQIAKAVQDGTNRFSVRLHPAELGRVEVSMDIAHDGRVTAIVSADRQETLDLLQRDSRSLERALADSGLRADTGSLKFSLGNREDGSRDAGNGGPGGPEIDPDPETPLEDIGAPIDVASLLRRTGGGQALDITI
ncbi:MAG: flagellar hook-length control protein FliK [Sphingomonadales bacterium]